MTESMDDRRSGPLCIPGIRVRSPLALAKARSGPSMALRSFCWDFMAIRRRDVQPRSFVRTRRAEPVHYAAAAPVAQLDRASGFEPEGREFESLRARQI